MKVEIKDVAESSFNDIPEMCRLCLYWSFPQDFEAEQLKYKQRIEARKKQWLLQTLKEFGTCSKILYHNNVAVGYVEYGPSNRFPHVKAYRSKPIGRIEDGVVFLSCLCVVDENSRGKGLGEKLLDNVIAELEKRGFKAIETYAGRGSPYNPSGPVELYLKKGFQIKDETDPKFPIVRLNL